MYFGYFGALLLLLGSLALSLAKDVAVANPSFEQDAGGWTTAGGSRFTSSNGKSEKAIRAENRNFKECTLSQRDAPPDGVQYAELAQGTQSAIMQLLDTQIEADTVYVWFLGW